MIVATVLTACGIETTAMTITMMNYCQLQQCLPLAVLKPNIAHHTSYICQLQQCLPLAVLKHSFCKTTFIFYDTRCNSAYRLRYWNDRKRNRSDKKKQCCNSAYRLRYWNGIYHVKETIRTMAVATVLTACGIETCFWLFFICKSEITLQQCLPLAVLKL